MAEENTNDQAAAKSWIRRQAESLSKESEEHTLPADALELMLEAAVEMKCVTLKILLARCWELFRVGDEPQDGFLDEVLKAIK